jgi:hypothetical protein
MTTRKLPMGKERSRPHGRAPLPKPRQMSVRIPKPAPPPPLNHVSTQPASFTPGPTNPSPNAHLSISKAHPNNHCPLPS